MQLGEARQQRGHMVAPVPERRGNAQRARQPAVLAPERFRQGVELCQQGRTLAREALTLRRQAQPPGGAGRQRQAQCRLTNDNILIPPPRCAAWKRLRQ